MTEERKRQDSQEMQVRRMKEGDGEAVAALEARLFSDAWSLSAVKSGLAAPAQTFFVVQTDAGKIIGYAAIMTVMDEGELLRIGTDPDFQRQGAASLLMDQVMKTAEEKGLSFMLLEVRQSNVPAVSLYEKYGFGREGVRRNYYQDPVEDALIMRREFSVRNYR